MTFFQQIQQGWYYFLWGWQLICQKGLRRFVLMPVICNVLLLIGLLYVFISHISQQLHRLTHLLPDFLSWLSPLLFIGAILLLLFGYAFIFNGLSGFLLAPFNGILAENVEAMLCGKASKDEGWRVSLKMLPRTIQREWQKITYNLVSIFVLFLLSFIPILGQTLVPCGIFLFMAWSQSLQYIDYPFDNHHIPFNEMKKALKRYPYMHLSFGGLVMFCTFVPLINFVVIPVAVCGATAMWVKCYRE